MKIYVAVDMEGIGGIVLKEQVFQDQPEYQRMRGVLTDEVNALVDGCFDGGATEVIVRDAHARGYNFLVEKLNAKAQYVLGTGSVEHPFPGLDDTVAGLILEGYHAMAGTESAVRDHTMSSLSWQNFWINGKLFGEIGIHAAMAGCYNVPTILVTGDDKACAEARKFLGKVITAQVKVGFGRHIAKMLAPEAARRLVREKAAEAVAKCGTFKPFKVKSPVTARLELMATETVPRHRKGQKGFRQIDGRTYDVTGRDILEVMRNL